MHPVIFRFSVFAVTSYSALLALSFAMGALLAAHRARQRNIDPACILRLSIYIFVAAVAGSHVAYSAVNYRGFPHNLFDLYHNGTIQLSGLVMNGGVVLAVIVVWAYTRFHDLSLPATLDAIAPSFAVGMFFTRLGCFLNGCCFGRATDLPWAVVFPAGTPAGSFQRLAGAKPVPIHPAQIYSALCGLAIFIAALAYERRGRRMDGAVTVLVLMLYAVSRFALEFFRAPDSDIDIHFALNHNQYVSLFLIAAGSAATALLAARSHKTGKLICRNS